MTLDRRSLPAIRDADRGAAAFFPLMFYFN